MSGAAWCTEGMEKKIIDNAAIRRGPDRSNLTSSNTGGLDRCQKIKS